MAGNSSLLAGIGYVLLGWTPVKPLQVTGATTVNQEAVSSVSEPEGLH